MDNETNATHEQAKKNSLPPELEKFKFKKGCTPWNKGKKMPKKENEKKQDDGTVEIKIVKEKKPLPPKDFEGKLEDVRERCAIGFIRSVDARKPREIVIAGQRFFSNEIVAERDELIIKLKDNLHEICCLAEKLNESAGTFVKLLKRELCFWKWLSIILIASHLIFLGLRAVYTYKQHQAENGQAEIEMQTVAE